MRLWIGAASLALALSTLVGAARAQITSSIQVVDSEDSLAAVRPALEECARAAMDEWAKVLRTPGGPVNVRIKIIATSAVQRAGGRSGTTTFVANRGGFNVFEQSLAAKVRSGIETNGAAEDIEVVINPTYALNTLWYDPDPTVRTEPVPSARNDAISVLVHEFGHALAFNGWRAWSTGLLPADYQSPFDELVNTDGPNFVFTGPYARAYYGGNDVPLTDANIFHVGNWSPGMGSDLLPDLMNGVVFTFGQRYSISKLDLAICRDLNIPVRLGCNRADVAGLGGTLEGDDQLTVDDLIAYLDAFFNGGNDLGDVCGLGGAAVPDGMLTADDLIVFLNAFFGGCP